MSIFIGIVCRCMASVARHWLQNIRHKSMLYYCPQIVVCVVVVVTYVSSPVLLLPLSSPRPWSFCPQQIRPACPCHGCRRRSAHPASRWMRTTTTTPRASLVFQRAERPKHRLRHNIFVMLVVPTCLHQHNCCCYPSKMPLSKSVCVCSGFQFQG